MTIRVGIVRVLVGLSAVILIASQMPGINSVAFASPRCDAGFRSGSGDANNDPFGFTPQDYAVGTGVVLGTLGVLYAVDPHLFGGHTASTQTVSPNGPQQVHYDSTVKALIAASAR